MFSRLLLVMAGIMGFSCFLSSSSFTLTMMGGRRRKGNLKNTLQNSSSSSKKSEKNSIASLNQGRGQEITGVTIPAEGKVNGWQFGNNKVIAAVNVEGKLYAVQGDCPRCSFDLYKGDVITDEAFDDAPGGIPRIACPTCGTTYSLKNGLRGPTLKRTGLAGFVSGLAKTATVNESDADAKAFTLFREVDTGRLFMKER